MARATPDTEYYKTTQVSPTAASTGSAIGALGGAGLGAWIGNMVVPGLGALVGAGLGAGLGSPIGTAVGAAAGEEEVELPVTASPARYAPPGPSSLSGLATQGWAWERIFADMDKKAGQENPYGAELRNLLGQGQYGIARGVAQESQFPQLAQGYSPPQIPAPYP